MLDIIRGAGKNGIAPYGREWKYMPDVTVAKVMQKMVEYLKGDQSVLTAIKVHSFVRNIALLSIWKRDKYTGNHRTASRYGIPKANANTTNRRSLSEMEGLQNRNCEGWPLEQDDSSDCCRRSHPAPPIGGLIFKFDRGRFSVNLHEHASEKGSSRSVRNISIQRLAKNYWIPCMTFRMMR